MADSEESYVLRGKIQIDDSYLGGELPGARQGGYLKTRCRSLRTFAGRGRASDSSQDHGREWLQLRCTAARSKTTWHLEAMGSDILACFRSDTTAG